MIEAARQYQHYEVLRREDGSLWELGRGAMGITYKAYDVNLCCEVALKVVNSALLDHPDARDRFVREARAAAALRHRHVASVYHLGNDGERFFYAMEFIDGETLDALVRRRGPLPVNAALRIILQVSKALVAADRQHLVHRDIKPANLMIVHEDADEDATIKVIDFGLARPAAGAEGVASVTFGGFVGTPQYASPEQLEELPLDARSDLYSLGVTTWYLLTGRAPFSGPLASVCQQQMSKPPPWHTLPADLPEGVRRLLECLLEKDPARRPQSARELRDEIEKCLTAVPHGPSWGTTLGGADETDDSVPSKPELPGRRGLAVPPTLAEGRFTGLEFLDEEPGVAVYRARDEKRSKRFVTVQVLSAGWIDTHGGPEALAEEVRLIQASVHPNLVQIYGLEPPAAATPALLVEEALVGFNLRELLAARGGTLAPREVLTLLEQAATGIDHAEGRHLEHLDLSLRHLRVHFPFAGGGVDGDKLARNFLPLPFAEWPEWTLKIHPLTTARDDLDPGTWAGDVTLLPTPGVRAFARAGSPESTGKWLPRLARLVYELLGGTFPARTLVSGQPGRIPALPGLTEEGNTVLLAALAAEPTDASCLDFHAALAATVDHRRALGGSPSQEAYTQANPVAPPPSPRPPKRDSEAARNVGGVVATTVRGSAGGSMAPASHRSKPALIEGDETKGSIVGLFADRTGSLPALPAEIGAGSAWERLALNRRDAARPGRWLLGLVATLLVFIGAFAGVLVFLLHDGSGGHRRDGERRSTQSVTGPVISKAPGPSRASVVAARPLASTTEPKKPTVSRVLPVAEEGVPSVPITVTDVLSTPATPEPSAPFVTPPALPPQAALSPTATPDQRISVHVESNPTGASVWWHDERIGVTPVDLHLPPGDHDLIARRRGSLDTHAYLHLEPGHAPAPEMIRLMDPSFVPSFQTAPVRRNERALRPLLSRPDRPTPEVPARVRPAEAVSPPSAAGDHTPVLRPLPLEPFEQTPNQTPEREPAPPTPERADEGDD